MLKAISGVLVREVILKGVDVFSSVEKSEKFAEDGRAMLERVSGIALAATNDGFAEIRKSLTEVIRR